MRPLFIGLLIPLGALLPTAEAGDSWSTPHTGMRLLHRTASGPVELWALEVDLCARGISLRATAEDERKQKTSSFAGEVDAQAAVNGGFFSYEDYYPGGLAIGDGVAWNEDTTTHSSLIFGRDNAQLRAESEDLTSYENWMHEAVSGYPRIVVDGDVPSSFSRGDCDDRHPRTAAGLSRDRQTLYLVTLDGRSGDSIGATCEELGEVLAGLGAEWAVNLDGGGSTTLWIDSKGVVNNPSDGSERTVGNHLGIWATGTGAPESCDFYMGELETGANILEAEGATDVNGDGLPDACARGPAGLECHLGQATGGWGDTWTLESLSDDHGWDKAKFYSTLRMGDLNGDGRTDVCARGSANIYCWTAEEAGFSDTLSLAAATDAAGYDQIDYYSTLRLFDWTGDGKADLCYRSPEGMRCHASNGAGFDAAIEGPAWSDTSGWSQPYYYGTIRTGDVNGDGRGDLCARSSVGVTCTLSDGASFPTVITGPAWSNDLGWKDVRSWSTLRLTDIDGDFKADLLGRDASGLWFARSTGEAFEEPVLVRGLSDETGWWDHSNYETLRTGDLDADGDRDLCLRADAGYVCYLWNGAVFDEKWLGPVHADSSGWDDHRYYSTFRMADLNGDGISELCDRSASNFNCYTWDGSTSISYGTPIAWSNAEGWDGDGYYSTLRLASAPPPRPALEPTDTGDPTDPADTGASPDTPAGDSGQSEGGGAPAEGRGQVYSGESKGCGCGGKAMLWPLLLGPAALRRRRHRQTPPDGPTPPPLG